MKQFTLIAAAAALLSALPALAQDAAPAEALPPAQTETLPPGGDAPVDQIAPIADVAPDGGSPDAVATDMACTFQTECTDAECAASGYEGRLTVTSMTSSRPSSVGRLSAACCRAVPAASRG